MNTSQLHAWAIKLVADAEAIGHPRLAGLLLQIVAELAQFDGRSAPLAGGAGSSCQPVPLGA